MKKKLDVRFTIIGLGNLLESIFPYIADIIGKENLSKQVNATTADVDDKDRKEKRLGIKVILNDNLRALKEMEPDVIFFAPPPNIAPQIIQTDLKRYFDFARANSAVVPEIYSFPPVPSGVFYNKVLGEDVHVVTIIPNTVTKINKKHLRKEGVSICTFSKKWPEKSLYRLIKIISPLGVIIKLKPEELIPVLGGAVMVHVLPEVVLSIAELLEKKGRKNSCQQLGDYMRAIFQKETQFLPEESELCSIKAVETDLRPALDAIIIGWYKGLLQYYSNINFVQENAIGILNPMIDHQLHIVQGERREVIENNIRMETTKGGILEMGIRSFHEQIKPVIEKSFENLTEVNKDQLQTAIFNRIQNLAYAVQKHGKNLAEEK